MDYKTYIAGLIGGFTGVCGSHPFDTIKTVYQNPKTKGTLLDVTKHIYKTNGIRGFYKGLSAPLFGIGLEKAIVFGTYTNVRNLNIFENNNFNIFFGGVVSGLLCTSIVLPVEKIKIRKQRGKNSNLFSIIKNEGIGNLYKGLSATLLRDTPGYGIYFLTYETLTKNKTKTPFETAFYGACSGAFSWFFIYPSDPIKTLMQHKNYSFTKASKIIYNQAGIRGFYRGYGMGLFRAMPLHGFVFLGVESFKKYIN
jgi:solute carrier family 25 carnitine/acylcarnitine transporter 20/29